MSSTHYDMIIIGGGPIGAALALALRNTDLKICVLEARAANTVSPDTRALALSYGSRLVLHRLGIWDFLHDITPINTIHISQKNHFGRTLLQASETKVPHLGYVLPYKSLQAALEQSMLKFNVNIQYDAKVSKLTSNANHSTINYIQNNQNIELTTHMAVIADGGKLFTQRHPPKVRDYGQTALISHISCSAPLANTAFERFTSQGPIALLPFNDGYELVWTTSHQEAREMQQWDDQKFLIELQHHFGNRVGKFLSASSRSCFKLGLKRAPQPSPEPHTILLGNAAQTLHPVAGQGFNLGLRDAWELAEIILNTRPAFIGTDTMLTNYQRQRQIDRTATICFTDGLVRLFSNDLPVISTARAATLSLLDCLPFSKNFIAKRMLFGTRG